MSAEMSDEKTEPATVTVSMQETTEESEKLDAPETREIDIHDRDPNDLNPHVKIGMRFHDVIGEPDEEVFSFDKVWVLSYKVFTSSKLWCYRITSLICALPLSLCWGIYFACVSFCSIWVCMPFLKCIDVKLTCVRRIWDICLTTFLAPYFEAIGKCWRHIRIRIQRE